MVIIQPFTTQSWHSIDLLATATWEGPKQVLCSLEWERLGEPAEVHWWERERQELVNGPWRSCWGSLVPFTISLESPSTDSMGNPTQSPGQEWAPLEILQVLTPLPLKQLMRKGGIHPGWIKKKKKKKLRASRGGTFVSFPFASLGILRQEKILCKAMESGT